MFLNGSEPPCRLTGKIFQEGDFIVQFPSLPIDRDDPLWDYNEWPMLREAFDKWEHREAFLAYWQRFVRTSVARLQRVLIDRADFFLLLGWIPLTIGLYFLRHGFSLFIPEDDWSAFVAFVLQGTQPAGDFHLSDNMQVSVGEEENKIGVTYKSSTPAGGRQDRILLDQLEWKALKEVLQEVDRIFPQVNK
jgi:hypothetical protein